MKIYHVEEISLVLWIFAAFFLIISLFLFFAFHIARAFKIVIRTNFKIAGKTSKEIKSQSKELIQKRESNKLYSNRIVSGGGANKITNSGETVLLEDEEQERKDGQYEETSFLTNFDFMKETARDEASTTVLEKDTFELVVDLMFIHTEQRI